MNAHVRNAISPNLPPPSGLLDRSGLIVQMVLDENQWKPLQYQKSGKVRWILLNNECVIEGQDVDDALTHKERLHTLNANSGDDERLIPGIGVHDRAEYTS